MFSILASLNGHRTREHRAAQKRASELRTDSLIVRRGVRLPLVLLSERGSVFIWTAFRVHAELLRFLALRRRLPRRSSSSLAVLFVRSSSSRRAVSGLVHPDIVAES